MRMRRPGSSAPSDNQFAMRRLAVFPVFSCSSYCVTRGNDPFAFYRSLCGKENGRHGHKAFGAFLGIVRRRIHLPCAIRALIRFDAVWSKMLENDSNIVRLSVLYV